jgi:hypothetical protein
VASPKCEYCQDTGRSGLYEVKDGMRKVYHPCSYCRRKRASASPKVGLSERAYHYLIERVGYSDAELTGGQAGNQVWRHMVQFARRELDRERRRARKERGR